MTRRAALAAGLAALTGCGGGAEGEPPPEPDHVVLNGLLAREQALESASPPRSLAAIAARHRAHVSRLRAAVLLAGGMPGAAPATATTAGLADLERDSLRAYVEALPLLAEAEFRLLASEVLADNAQHLALLREADGAEPLSDAFGGFA